MMAFVIEKKGGGGVGGGGICAAAQFIVHRDPGTIDVITIKVDLYKKHI